MLCTGRSAPAPPPCPHQILFSSGIDNGLKPARLSSLNEKMLQHGRREKFLPEIRGLMGINRRQFLRRAAGAVSTATLMGSAGSQLSAAQQTLPTSDESEIDHIVVVMMENRSFDHLLGWLPGANGRQAGLSYLDKHGEAHPTYRLTTFVGCSHPDPDHSYSGGRSEYDEGKWTDGCVPPAMTSSASVITRKPTCPFSARWRVTSPPRQLLCVHPFIYFSQSCFPARRTDRSFVEYD